MDIWTGITTVLIVLLFISGFLGYIKWQLNFLVIFVLVVFWFVALYNGLVRIRTRAREAFSDIDVQLKRRHDLIPNLVETVKGYAAHEKGVFEKVTEARSRAMGAKTVGERAKAENALSKALMTLYAVSERYPELKASTNFLELQREIRDTEDKIQAARRFYNTNVRDLNIMVETFPANLVASTLGFKKIEFFEIEAPAEREAPKVKF